MILLLLGIVLIAFSTVSHGFTIHAVKRSFPIQTERSLFESSQFLAVETFDGSTVDPVVVSTVFWTSLKAKLISALIGQVISSIVFCVLASLAANQISNFGDYLADKFSFFKQETVVTEKPRS